VSSAEAHRLIELARGSVVLEVGSWWGFSTVAMALVAERVHAVDWHLGDDHAGHDESLAPLMENLDRYGVRDRVVVHVGDAGVVVPMFPRGFFDLAFIDAFHTREAVARDADAVLPTVHVHGFIAFHDYGRFEVKEAVDAIVADGSVAWVDLTETLAVVRKL
jgi:predicted O-methyltransferase YrrM